MRGQSRSRRRWRRWRRRTQLQRRVSGRSAPFERRSTKVATLSSSSPSSAWLASRWWPASRWSCGRSPRPHNRPRRALPPNDLRAPPFPSFPFRQRPRSHRDTRQPPLPPACVHLPAPLRLARCSLVRRRLSSSERTRTSERKTTSPAPRQSTNRAARPASRFVIVTAMTPAESTS